MFQRPIFKLNVVYFMATYPTGPFRSTSKCTLPTWVGPVKYLQKHVYNGTQHHVQVLLLKFSNIQYVYFWIVGLSVRVFWKKKMASGVSTGCILTIFIYKMVRLYRDPNVDAPSVPGLVNIYSSMCTNIVQTHIHVAIMYKFWIILYMNFEKK